MATLHVVGSIDPPPSTTLLSAFYPTAYPTKRHPGVGLLADEKMTLDNIATQFKNFGIYEHNASLVVIGYADARGSRRYNNALSERRAALIRDYSGRQRSSGQRDHRPGRRKRQANRPKECGRTASEG